MCDYMRYQALPITAIIPHKTTNKPLEYSHRLARGTRREPFRPDAWNGAQVDLPSSIVRGG